MLHLIWAEDENGGHRERWGNALALAERFKIIQATNPASPRRNGKKNIRKFREQALAEPRQHCPDEKTQPFIQKTFGS